MIKRLIVSIVVLAILLPSTRSRAEIYRYTDDKGGLHYVDDISLVPEKHRGQLTNAKPLPEISIVSPGSPPVKSNTKSYDEPQKKPEISKSVEVFVTSWCPYCKKLEALLNSKGISYTRYDIEKDQSANKVFKELGGRGVPLTTVDSNIIHGYNPEAIIRLIK
ncbi:hypothetical protein HY949_01710 [Candidatus Gottesmanbacteria bacterium]|nr:hypothetical protein [Candidatus Gottesmanbacteria bacterium]